MGMAHFGGSAGDYDVVVCHGADLLASVVVNGGTWGKDFLGT